MLRQKKTYTFTEEDLEEIIKNGGNSEDLKLILKKFEHIEYSLPDDEYSLSYFPVKFRELEEKFDEQFCLFWTPSDFVFTEKDRDQWHKLDENSRNYVKFILCLFAQLDGIVGKNLSIFVKDTSFIKECSWFYAIQGIIETVHNKVYSLLLQNFISDQDEFLKCLNSIKNISEIGNIAQWVSKWMNPSVNLLKRIIGFVALEGVIFNSAFVCVYWMKRRKKLAGFTKPNEWIARDERIHAEFGITLYKLLTSTFTSTFTRLTEEEVHEIIREGVDVNKELTRKAVGDGFLDLNLDDLLKCVESIADGISVMLGYNKIYNTINPLKWMISIGLTNKTNFFEDKVSEYTVSSNLNENYFDPDFEDF
jgi:ribonucleotide reductase beta subunit family protein with ferritin-like domain